MVGSAILRRLRRAGYENVLTQARAELDLTDQRQVNEFLSSTKPDFIIVAAARVGGIEANNNYRAEFLFENLAIECNLIHGAHQAGVDRLMFLGSSCIYPRDCSQPMREEYLLTGPLEKTNEPYAIAKIAGIKLCETYSQQYGHRYVSVMPTNTYGPNDTYELDTSHVLPALIRKAHEAKERGDGEYVVWGSGTARREFIFVDDLADACVHLMIREYAGPLINIGTGVDITIRELAELVMQIVGFDGKIVYDARKPDGSPRKLLDVSRLTSLGWKARTSLPVGIRLAYEAAPFFLQSHGQVQSHD